MTASRVGARDELAKLLVGKTQGVVSVGLGKKDGELVLAVMTDEHFGPDMNLVPDLFEGFEVVIVGLGKAKLY